MNDTTLAALRALADALFRNPADARALQIYGQMPRHLADALEDYDPDTED